MGVALHESRDIPALIIVVVVITSIGLLLGHFVYRILEFCCPKTLEVEFATPPVRCKKLARLRRQRASAARRKREKQMENQVEEVITDDNMQSLKTVCIRLENTICLMIIGILLFTCLTPRKEPEKTSWEIIEDSFSGGWMMVADCGHMIWSSIMDAVPTIPEVPQLPIIPAMPSIFY